MKYMLKFNFKLIHKNSFNLNYKMNLILQTKIIHS